MTRPRAASRPGEARKLLHQERVRQPVKAVAPHAPRLVAARDRQHPGHARQIVVKRGVEARDLRQVGKPPMERLASRISSGRCSGSNGLSRRSSATISGGDSLRLAVRRPAVHHAMPDRGQRASSRRARRASPSDCRLPRCDPAPSPAARSSLRGSRSSRGSVAPGQSDPLDLRRRTIRRSGCSRHSNSGELDARRAAVDRQDALD